MTSVHEETRLVLLIKGKRTKRQRSASPLIATAAAVSSVCSGEIEDGEVEFHGANTDEDQDMANCLMLLSQGHNEPRKMGYLSGKKPVEGSLGLGLDGVYQCKTCDKSFHSFQALGGHRASHKKPRTGGNVFKCDEKKSAVETVESGGTVGSFLSLQVTSNDGNSSSKKPEKTHECSICKAEFSSGQALGGHMRRHRGLTVNSNANATSSTKTTISSSSSSHQHQYHHQQESIGRPKNNFLELDLNLPAPEDEPKFVFASKDQILLFASASNSLIDCHH